MSIKSAILHNICYNQDLNCSIFCKVDDDLVTLLVVTLTCPWSKTKVPAAKSSWVHRKLHLLIELCKASGFSFPVVYMHVSFISLHTCWSCHVLVGRTGEVPLPAAARRRGGQEPAPTLCPAVHPQLLPGPPLGRRRVGKDQPPAEMNKKQEEIPTFPLRDSSGWSTPARTVLPPGLMGCSCAAAETSGRRWGWDFQGELSFPDRSRFSPSHAEMRIRAFKRGELNAQAVPIQCIRLTVSACDVPTGNWNPYRLDRYRTSSSA